jgi:hypothetical protein
MVTDAQREAFARDGFVLIPDLLPVDQLRRWGAAVDRAVELRTAPGRRPLRDRSQLEQELTVCYNLWEDSAAVRQFTLDRRLAQAAAQLLDAPRVRLWLDRAVYKEPGSLGTSRHQDHTQFPIREIDTVIAWIPFDGSTLESGAMGYVPGSHRHRPLNLSDLFLGGAARAEVARLAQGEPVFLEVPPGAVAFHHVLTFHLSLPNRSERMRRAVSIVYFRDGSRRGSALSHPSVDRAQVGVGDEIAGDATPLVWPRADDQPLVLPPPLQDPPPGWATRSPGCDEG